MDIPLRPFQSDDADWLVESHRRLYAAEEGYDDSFAELVRDIVDAFLARNDSLGERGWVADRGGQRLGCIFCMADGDDSAGVARLRLFLVEPESRGTGLAQRMIEECLSFAVAAGYQKMRLWTHESHVAACRLYARNGFSCVESWPERTFGQEVVSQIWERAL